MSNTESWETALFILGLTAFLILSAWVYWRTSDSYKVRQAKKALGYEVDDAIAFVGRCWACFVGPMSRRKWEKEHEYFRSKAYGPPDPNWADLSPGQPWCSIERGEGRREKHLIACAIAQVKADVWEDEIEVAILAAFADLERTGGSDALAKLAHINKRASVFDLSAASAASREERLRNAQEDMKTEWGVIANPASLNIKMAGAQSAVPTAAAVVTTAPAATTVTVVSTPLPRTAAAAPMSAVSVPRDKEVVGVIHSNPLSMVQLRKAARSIDTAALVTQFSSVAMNFPDPSIFPRSLQSHNRLANLFPFKHNRVKVAPMGTDTDRYYNASYVRGADNEANKFIVAQGPLAGTEPGKKNTMPAFWHMIWQHHVHVIVMVVDTGAGCAVYWPAVVGAVATHGQVTVRANSVTKSKGAYYTVTVLSATHADFPGDMRLITHTQYHHWPSGRAPEAPTGVLAMLHEVSVLTDAHPRTPTLVHDALGAGAAGCVVALEHCIWQVEAKSMVDLLKTLAQLREDRAALVETAAQYIYVFRAVTMYCLAIDTETAPPTYNPAPSFEDSSSYGRQQDNLSPSKRRVSRAVDYEMAASALSADIMTESQGRGVPQWKRDMLLAGASIAGGDSAGQPLVCDNCNGALAMVHCAPCSQNLCNTCDALFVHITAERKMHKREVIAGAAAALSLAANVAMCENCSVSPAAVFCVLCNTTVCRACDKMVVHKDAAKRSHQRVDLVSAVVTDRKV